MDIRFAERFDGITGSEIRKIFALLNDPEMISLAGGNPSPQSFPAKEVAEIAEEIISKNSAVALQYGNTPGINDFLEPMRERRAKYEAQPALLDEIIDAGNTAARKTARETMGMVREAMKI